MTRREARLFAIVSTAVVTIAFLGMTIDSHRQFPGLTHEDKLTPQVIAGKNVWHKFNCTNCHTLLGEGAYYAPDLTKITLQRGPEYLKAFMHDPSKFYDEEKVRRVMPKLAIGDQEITDLIAFLDWIAHIDNQDWPARRILVSGTSIPGSNVSTRAGGGQAPAAPAASDEPVALGQALFNATPPGCSGCHSIAPGVNLVGPTLAGIGSRAAQVVNSPDYHGKAKDAAGYIRESITDPSAFVLPGPTYSADGRSLMPGNFGKDLTPQQIDQLVAYLATLK